MSDDVDIEQDRYEAERAAWLEWRREGIGGSDIAALIGASPWSTPYQVWLSKVHGIDADETEPMMWGSLIEPVILGQAERRLDITVVGRQLRCEHPDHPRHRSTLDALALEPDAGHTIVEVKLTAERWAWDEVPLNYWCQAQWQMWTAGGTVARVVFAVLHGGTRLEFYDVERDDADIDELAAAADNFWTMHVDTGDPPDVTHLDLPVVRRRVGVGEPGRDLIADDTLESVVDQFRTARDDVKAAERYCDALKARLIASLAGGHAGIVDRDGNRLATWKAPRSFDAAAAAAAHPALAAENTRPVLDVTAFRDALGRRAAAAFLVDDPDATPRLTVTNPKDD